jgi:hypothetical protein
MNEKTTISIDVGTRLGNAAMIQVLSAIAIIGVTLFFRSPVSEIVWLIFAGILYAIGFIQVLVTRYFLQRERNATLVAYIVSILAIVFSFGMALYWGIQLDLWMPASFYTLIIGLNVPLAAILRSERLLMSS